MKISYQTSVKELKKDFSKTGLINSIKSGEFDPKQGTFTIDFNDEMLTELAIKQLELIRKDLDSDRISLNFKSAYDFLLTEQFIVTCLVAGIDEDNAKEEAQYLYRRYSDVYISQLELAITMKGNLDSDLCKTLEFAFELAVEIYRKRLGDDLLVNGDFWEYLAKQNVKTATIKRHLCHLIAGPQSI